MHNKLTQAIATLVVILFFGILIAIGILQLFIIALFSGGGQQ